MIRLQLPVSRRFLFSVTGILAAGAGVYAGQQRYAAVNPFWGKRLYNDAAESHVEPKSGIELPRVAEFPASDCRHRLLGLGIRQITIFRFNTYVMGIYLSDLDIERLRNSAQWLEKIRSGAWLESEATKTKQENIVLKEFVRSCKELTLCLRPARNTNGSHLRNALTKMLRDRFTAQQKDTPDKWNASQKQEIEEAIEQFGRTFPNVSIAMNAQFTFAKVDSDKLRVTFNGNLVDVIQCRWLAENLPIAYLQASPLIPELKSMAAQELPQLIVGKAE